MNAQDNYNFDPGELNKFSALASTWWDPNGDLKTLHEVNPLRLEYIDKKIGLHGKTVLDIGCGGGILSESMARMGADVVGIDLNKSLIKAALLHQFESQTQVKYLVTSAEDLASETTQRYDVITCLELLEHVPHPKSILNACKKMLKPNGYLFLSTLNRNLKSYLLAILGAEYVLKLLPKNTHDYAKFIKPSELCDWLLEARLHPEEMKGIVYNPLTRRFKLSSDISVNYILCAKA